MIYITINITPLPTYYRLIECAEAMRLTHGHERADEWFGKTLAENHGLFLRMDTPKPRPKLTVIRGGA